MPALSSIFRLACRQLVCFLASAIPKVVRFLKGFVNGNQQSKAKKLQDSIRKSHLVTLLLLKMSNKNASAFCWLAFSSFSEPLYG